MKKNNLASTAVKEERWQLLKHITELTDKIMIALAFIWIGLMIADFIGKFSPTLEILNYIIWGIFIADFLIKFFIAPEKINFIRTHWITLISLILPAFRVLRTFQAFRTLRALRLTRVLTSINRGMNALLVTMGKRGFGYVAALTLLVLSAGAAGMYFFERPEQLIAEGYTHIVDQGGGLLSYSDSIWWTAMLMTTIASQYWPATTAGRILCWLLSLYSLAVFGYITAVIATYFIGKDTNTQISQSELNLLRSEIHALRTELKNLSS